MPASERHRCSVGQWQPLVSSQSHPCVCDLEPASESSTGGLRGQLAGRKSSTYSVPDIQPGYGDYCHGSHCCHLFARASMLEDRTGQDRTEVPSGCCPGLTCPFSKRRRSVHTWPFRALFWQLPSYGDNWKSVSHGSQCIIALGDLPFAALLCLCLLGTGKAFSVFCVPWRQANPWSRFPWNVKRWVTFGQPP